MELYNKKGGSFSIDKETRTLTVKWGDGITTEHEDFPEDPKCKRCKRELTGYYDDHRGFYKCQCGAEYKGYRPKEKQKRNRIMLVKY